MGDLEAGIQKDSNSRGGWFQEVGAVRIAGRRKAKVFYGGLHKTRFLKCLMTTRKTRNFSQVEF